MRLAHINIVLGVPKTTLNLHDLLGFTELRKVGILRVTVYYIERLQIKISEGERQLGEIQETLGKASSHPPTQRGPNSLSNDV